MINFYIGQGVNLLGARIMKPTKKFSFFIKLFILILLSAYLTGFLTSCGGTLILTWQAFFGGADDDAIYDIIQLSDGTYLAVGDTIGAASRDIYILKLNAFGQSIKEITYDGGYKDSAHSVKETSDGGFILTGTEEVSPSDLDICVLKYDPNGNLEWHKTFGSSLTDGEGYSIDATLDGGYIIAGVSGIYGYILKIDSNGNSDPGWPARAINVSGYSATSFRCIKSVSDGYIITGTVYDSSYNPHLLVMKIDSSGNQDWYYVLNIAQSMGFCVVESENGYVVAGSIQNPGQSQNGYVFEIAADGNTINWESTFGSAEYDGIFSIQPTADGNFIACGYYKSDYPTYLSCGYVLKISSTDGSLIWDRIFHGASGGPDLLNAIVQTSDGGYITAGSSMNTSGKTDAWILKLDSNGSL
jgi:hypothetical protein